MKRLIIFSLVLAVMLLFVNWSFAGWNESGFKNSPLFKHSLNETIAKMENQGKQAAAEGENMSTLSPKCNVPDAPVTYSNCETTENTCQGIPTCQQQTCFGTCYEPTCVWATCASTCESTCQSTCTSCPPAPPAVQGHVYHNYWGYFTNHWGELCTVNKVYQMMEPWIWVNFSKSDGYYFCDEWGQPAQQLKAIGKILGTTLIDNKSKPHQPYGSLIEINFYCTRENK